MSAHLREAVIDLDAVRENTAVLRERAGGADLMAVVKADAYGHGLVPCARATLAGGATWLGVALLEEALALRAAGITAPVLAWLLGPGDDLEAALRADVDLSVAAPVQLDAVVAAVRRTGRPARVHLKFDTGLGRGGAAPSGWDDLLAAVHRAQRDGLVEVVGTWSHFAYADAPGHPTVDRQLTVFGEVNALVARAGLRPAVRHLANSAATLTRPDAIFDMARPGLALYGLSPLPDLSAADLGLRPAMTLRAPLILVKRVAAGQGVSYLHQYVTERETTLGLVPLGYADGIPRAATNTGPVLAGGRRRTIAGTVCMDQFVVDLEDAPAAIGDEVIVFGDGHHGEPTVEDWARATGTISYEVVSRIGPRVARRYVGGG